MLVLGIEFDFVVFEMFDCDFCELLGINKPLFLKGWFDNCATFVTMSDGVRDFVRAEKDSLFFEVVKSEGAAFFGRKTSVALAADWEHVTVVTNYAEVFKVMALPYFEVVKIVRRSNLYGAGSVFWVGVFVGDNRDFAVGQRKFYLLPY